MELFSGAIRYPLLNKFLKEHREHVDINGTINSTDVNLVTSKKGTVLP